MTEITLARHGQASFGTDNYDQLSELGQRQARWLGESFAAQGQSFDRIIIGTQQRHRQTAEGILEGLGLSLDTTADKPPFEQHAGFNEYDFEAIYAHFSEQFPGQLETQQTGRKHFYTVLQRGLLAWSENRLKADGLESWQDFHDRISEAVSFADGGHSKKVLVVSSGGAISMVIGQALTLESEHIISLNLQAINSAYSRILVTAKRQHLLSFNNFPHLASAERQSSITYS